jgi:hypothetical protein
LRAAEAVYQAAFDASVRATVAAEVAKREAERIERENRAYREALGSLKAEMMALIEDQG